MKRLLMFALLTAATVLAPKDAHPDIAAAADVRGRDAIVARLGAPGRSITAGELEDRIAALPPFQRASYGATADLVRRNVLAQVLVPEALLAAGAADSKMADEPRTARELERVLSTATIRAIRARIGPAAAIPLDDVRTYYDDNRARYDAPERYQLWRILCKTRDEAALVLEQAKSDPTPKTFGELAREHSLDKASSLREGNLGFLTLDGASSEPGLARRSGNRARRARRTRRRARAGSGPGGRVLLGRLAPRDHRREPPHGRRRRRADSRRALEGARERGDGPASSNPAREQAARFRPVPRGRDHPSRRRGRRGDGPSQARRFAVTGSRVGAALLGALLAAAACRSPGKAGGEPTNANETNESGAVAVPAAAASPTEAGAPRAAPAASAEASARVAAAASSTPDDASAPSDAECERARREAAAQPKTQLGLNEQAGAKASLAACDVRRAHDDVQRALARNPEGLAALETAQRTWRAFGAAHELERFPHQDEPGYYGSVFPMCLLGERAAMSLARARELRASAPSPCKPGAPTPGQAGAVRAADAALNDSYRKVRSAYASEPAFLAALQRAELSWIAFRDAQVALASASSGGPESACAQREAERTTQARDDQLREWLKPREDGDACAGSFAPP